jgi:peptidoglycan/LPS O-acetylase OafA/YrhL
VRRRPAGDGILDVFTEKRAMMSYLRFGAMIVTSIAAMFLLTYVSTYEWSHLRFSETRAYMALLMGAAMAAIMLSYMLGMYERRRLNLAIYAASALVFAVALWLVRSQATVDEVSWMKAMIPHHSIAILTSERAHLSDPRARDLARRIVETQRSEIAEMNALIADLERRR